MADEKDYYAARVRDDEEGPRLVLVPARDRLDARRESGLIDGDFHLATDAELDDWETECERPLTPEDLRSLLGSVRRAQVGLANRLARERGFGRAASSSSVHPEQVEARRRKAHYKARKLAQLRGKLELMLETLDDAEEPAAEAG